LGVSTLDNSQAFKKIQFFSKINPQSLYMSESDYSLKYINLSNMYKLDYDLNNSTSYKTIRQHNYNNNLSINTNFNTFLDTKGVDKCINYNLTNYSSSFKKYNNFLDLSNNREGILKNLYNFKSLNNLNKSYLDYNFIDLKSPNKQILTSDRGIRSTYNLDFKDNNVLKNNLNLNTLFPISHLPTNFISKNNLTLSYDKYDVDNNLSKILRSKEESSPNFIFETY